MNSINTIMVYGALITYGLACLGFARKTQINAQILKLENAWQMFILALVSAPVILPILFGSKVCERCTTNTEDTDTLFQTKMYRCDWCFEDALKPDKKGACFYVAVNHVLPPKNCLHDKGPTKWYEIEGVLETKRKR